MATRYELNARITAQNDATAAFQSVTREARELKQALDALDERVNINIDLEDISRGVAEIKRELASLKREGAEIPVDIDDKPFKAAKTRITAEKKELAKDVEFDVNVDQRGFNREVSAINRAKLAMGKKVEIDLDLNTSKGRRELAAWRRETAALEKRDIQVNVDVDTGAATAHLIAFRNVLGPTSRAANNLETDVLDVGSAFVRSARVLTASGFLVQIAAIAPLAAGALAAVRPLTGALIVLGGLGVQVGVGAGLVAAAIVRIVKAAQEGQKYTKELRDEWSKLQAQFTGSRSVFDQAAKALVPLGTQILRLANQAMPALGRESTQVAKQIRGAFQDLGKEIGGNERNSLNRILDSTSEVMGDLTRAAGRVGAAFANIFGNKAVVRAVQDISEYIADAAKSFLEWSRSTRGANQIEGWIKSARILFKSLEEAIKDISDAMGEFSTEDVRTLGRAIEGTARFISALIRGLERLFDWVGKLQKQFKEWGISLKDAEPALKAVERALEFLGKEFKTEIESIQKFIKAGKEIWEWTQQTDKKIDAFVKNTLQSFDKWNKTGSKEFSQFVQDTAKDISKWATDTKRDFDNWVRDWEKKATAWHNGQKKRFDAWAKDTWTTVKDWSADTKKSFDDWIRNWEQRATKWHDGQKKRFDEWASDTWGTIKDWAGDTADTFADWITARVKQFGKFLSDAYSDFKEGFADIVDVILDTLDSALGPLDEWVGSAIDILNKIFDLLGINTSGDPNTSNVKDNPREIQSTGGRYEGGIYDTNNVRFMHEGGMIDTSGVYTALTTGMDQALSQGAMWQGPTGGISDGLSPRVVYGEGSPGQGPQKELYVPETLPADRQLDLLSEWAKGLGAVVGFGSNQPHAHWLSEADRVMSGPGQWVMAGGGIIERYPQDPLSFQAPVDDQGNRSPSSMSNSSSGSGGYVLGIAPPNSLLNSFMEYIPGYPYGNEHHLGVDIVPGGDRSVHAPAAYVSTGQWDRSSYGEGLFLEYNVQSTGGSTYSAFAGHLGSIGATSGKPDQVMGTIGSYSGWGGGPDHMHIQTAPHGAPVGMDPGGLIDPFQWWPAVGGNTAIPPGYSGSSGYDIWAAVQALIDQIEEPNMGEGPYFAMLEPAIFDAVVGAITEFARNHLPAFSGAPGSGADVPGQLPGWAKQGLEYGNTVEPSQSNIDKIVTLAMQESGGDPNAVNESSGASGLMQMLLSTFQAYQVSSGDDVFNPVDNVAASSRYQVDRYGSLVTTSPYTRGGIALEPQIASVAEHGPEFFMPLHDPESARRFMSFLESAAVERAERGKLPWQRDMDGLRPHSRDSGRSRDNDIMERELKAIHKKLASLGIDEDSAERIGKHAAKGVLDRIKKNAGAQDTVNKALGKHKNRRDSAVGRRYSN